MNTLMFPSVGEIIKDQIQTDLAKYREIIVSIKNALKESIMKSYMNPSNVCNSIGCIHCGQCGKHSRPLPDPTPKQKPEKKETEDEKEIRKMEENIKKLKEKKEIEEKIKKKRGAIDEYLLKIKYEEQCIADLEKRLQELKNEGDQ